MLKSKMLSSRRTRHMVQEGLPEAVTKGFLEGAEHNAHTVCARTPGQEDSVQQTMGCANCCSILCTRVTSGGYLASLWPLEALYPRHLVSLEDSVSPPGDNRKGCPHCSRSTAWPPLG